MSSDADPARLAAGLSTRWATTETSFKWHASCRHTHPAADALLCVMREHGLAADDIGQFTALVHQGALDVLGPVTDPQSVHQAKFNMPSVLALAALHGHAGLGEFDAEWNAPRVASWCGRVQRVIDAEVDAAYPARWIGKVQVHTRDGRTLHGRIDELRGDPGNTLSRADHEAKAPRLAAYRGGASAAEMHGVIARVGSLADAPQVARWLI